MQGASPFCLFGALKYDLYAAVNSDSPKGPWKSVSRGKADGDTLGSLIPNPAGLGAAAGLYVPPSGVMTQWRLPGSWGWSL